LIAAKLIEGEDRRRKRWVRAVIVELHSVAHQESRAVEDSLSVLVDRCAQVNGLFDVLLHCPELVGDGRPRRAKATLPHPVTLEVIDSRSDGCWRAYQALRGRHEESIRADQVDDYLAEPVLYYLTEDRLEYRRELLNAVPS
jgi:hypothetical protein